MSSVLMAFLAAMLAGWTGGRTPRRTQRDHRDHGTDVITAATVTPTFFSTAGGHVVLGRGLGPADDGSPSVVISHRLWQRAFGSAATILGQQIVLDRQPYSVVRVADTTFQLPSPRTDAWQPVGYARTLNPSLGLPRGGGFQPLARLKPGATVAQAQAEADVVCRSLDAKLHATAIPLREWFLTTAVGSTLLVLWTAVGLVLFVACANVAARNFAASTTVAASGTGACAATSAAVARQMAAVMSPT